MLKMAHDEIAIVGVGCRFPGADDLDGFWRVLSKGENHVLEIPRERWDLDSVYDADPNAPRKTNVRRAGFLKDYNEWDPKLFGINEMEAGEVDPQQRMVLDCVHMALEDGGIRRQDIDGSYTGVYIGSMNDDFKTEAMASLESVSAYTVTGLHSSIISARVAYVYNLHGPAVTMDTACSSSLVAINCAEQALKLGECDAAICGGANSILDAVQFVALSKARMLSPTGQSKPFSADADGYARGEGCGIVILKRLKDALRDGNKIWATLTTGCNQDGNTATPITAPSGSMQMDLLQRLYDRSKVDKYSVQVIEAHGTGTPIGDPVETNALGKFFGRPKGSNIFIGSVKSNIGHTEAAAGAAGLIKVLLMMKNGQVAPSLLLDKTNVNPRINFNQYCFTVPTAVTPWPRPAIGKRIACVNSFGFGGTNSHAIVHEFVHTASTKGIKEKSVCKFPPFITISALDQISLSDQVKNLRQRLKETDCDIRTLSYTSTCRRDHRLFRKAFVGETKQELIKSCDKYVDTPTQQTLLKKTRLVFVFCGVGTTWQGMCSFMMKVAVFREAIQAIDKFLVPLSGWTLTSKLSSTIGVAADPIVNHIAIFGCQVGLAELWSSIGVCPDIVIGQSVGEVAAAYTSGSIDLQSAVRVIYYRSKFLSEVRNGTMAVVKNVETSKIEEFCSTTNGKLCVAVYISPTSCTISGDKKSIDNFKEKLNNGLRAPDAMLIELDVACAYHSRYVETAAKKATQMLKNLKPGNQVVPIISTVTGKEERHTTFANASYWEKNTRHSVRFGDAVLQAAEKFNSHTPVFLEIGPAPVLGAHVNTLFKNQAAQLVLPSMKKGSEAPTLCSSICKIYEIGLPLKWERLVTSSNTVTDVPKYVFRLKKTPFKSKQILTNTSAGDENTDHMYISINDLIKKSFHIQVNEASTPFIFDHVVKGTVLVPGAFHADIGFKIAKAVFGSSTRDTVVSLEFTKPARIGMGMKTQLLVEIGDLKRQEFSFFVKQEKSLVCIGNVAITSVNTCPEAGTETKSHCMQQPYFFNEKKCNTLEIEKLRLEMDTDLQIKMDSTMIYGTLSKMGFQYGPCFQVLKECLAKERTCLATISIPNDVFKDVGRTIVHPCLLDGMLQSTFLATDKKFIDITTEENLALLPVAIQSVTVYGRPKTTTVYAYAKMVNSTVLPTVLKLHYDILLLNTDSTIIADVKNYTTYCRRNMTLTPDELRYQLTWIPINPESCASSISPKILYINTNWHQDRIFTLDSDNDVVCYLETSQLTEDMLEDSLVGPVKKTWNTIDDMDATVVFLGELFCKDIDLATAGRIYEMAKQNCMFLTWLLRYLMNRKQVPLFIITENTQHVDKSNSGNINLTGCGVWGFMRNVLIEFIHDNVVLVDLQPSLEDTRTTLLDFLTSSIQCIESTQTEYVIKDNVVFGGNFLNSRVTEMMPNLRQRMHPQLESNGVVISKNEDSLFGAYIVKDLENQMFQKMAKDSIEIKVTSVSLQDDSIFPPIASSLRPSHCSISEGHPMIAIEYTGFEFNSKRNGRFYRCGNNSVAVEDIDRPDRWQVAVIYPNQIKTVTVVPRGCSVNLQKLPFYKPNLLTYAILFWHMTKAVRNGSTVNIMSEPPHSEYKWLLERMFKQVLVTVVDHDNPTSADTLVLVGKYHESHFDMMKSVKNIIAVQFAIPGRIQKNLKNCRGTIVNEIDTHFIFSKNEVSKSLQKVVSKLKQILSPDDKNRDHTMSEKHVCISDGIQTKLQLKLPLEDHFVANSVFVITGGLTGLGWQTILMLVESGIGTVATMSRREVDEETKMKIEDTEMKFGCKILCFRGDVCNIEAVTRMIDELTKEYGKGRIRGIIHGAGVLDGQLLVNVGEEHLDRVMAPKVLGVMNLHIATKHLSLDFFITQSSISSIIGMPGQGNYGAANIFMDVFALWRRSKGLAAQSINWGALEVGMAAQEQFMAKMVKRGFNLLSIAEMRDCLLHAIMQNATGVVYANLDWSKIAKEFSESRLARTAVSIKEVIKRKNAHLILDAHQGENHLNIESLKSLNDASLKLEIEKFVVAVIIRTIGSDVETLTIDNTFVELALESLAAVTFTTVVYQETGCRIDLQTLNEKSLGDVVAEICSHIK